MNTEKELKITIQEDDLEDGEIDSSEEDNVALKEESAPKEQLLKMNSISGTSIDSTKIKIVEQKAHTRESGDGDDDFADNLEKKLAAILKKEGIVPKIPEIVLEKRKKIKEEAIAGIDSSQSKSSRRRKRKRTQKEKDREKDLEKVSNITAIELAS